jgi:hypothetical protein
MNTTQTASHVKRFLKENIHSEMVPALEQLVNDLPDDLVAFADTEQLLRDHFLKLAGKMLQNWSLVAITQIAIPLCMCCGKPMRHKGLKPITLTTTIGDISLRRPRYRCESCKLEVYPHDQHIRLLSNGVSLTLGKVICRMAADRPFGRAAEDLLEDYGVRLCKQTVEYVAESAGKHINAIEDQRRETLQGLAPQDRVSVLPSPTGESGQIAVACCDGAMIHTGSEPEYLQNKDDKPGWHEVRAASVAVGNPVKDKAKPTDGKPDKGHHFRMDVLRTHSFARFETVENIGMEMYLRACESGFFDAPLQCFLSDGATWLRNIAEEHFPNAILILDWYHVTEYICKAAAKLFGQGTAQAKRWVEYREAELWDGRIGAVLAAINQERQKDGLRKEQREILDSTYGYIEGNRDRMRYPAYRELGLPIGSGRAEGLCKTLVEGRCKQSGMRNWTPTGAEAILRLRAARHDKVFNETWRHYFVPAA